MIEPQLHQIDGQPLTASPELGRGYPAREPYRQLVARGFAPAEAANLTAFLNGIAIGPKPWALQEISHVLFLRELNHMGRFGPDDGAA